jgi:chromosome partitioning related protein ParA
MIVLSFVSTKGGVGKTTLAANIGGILADMGLRVLMVDADIRPMLSKYYTLEKPAEDGFFAVISKSTVTPAVIGKTNIPNLDLVVSDVNIADVIGWMRDRLDRDVRLRNALRCPYVEDHYDAVIIDSQGAQGVLQEAAALAADEIISPVVPEVLSVREFRDGTIELYARLHQSRIQPGPLRAVFNRQPRTRDAKDLVMALREEQRAVGINSRVSIMNTIIPSAKAYTEAATLRIPVHQHETRKDNPQSITANQTLHQLIWELLPSLDGVYAATRWESGVDLREVVNG